MREEPTIVENSHAVVEGLYWEFRFGVFEAGFGQLGIWYFDLGA